MSSASWDSIDANRFSSLSLVQAIAVLREGQKQHEHEEQHDDADAPRTPAQQAYQQALRHRYTYSVAAKHDPHLIQTWNEMGIATVQWEQVKQEAERKAAEIEAGKERQRQKEAEEEEQEGEAEGEDEDEENEAPKEDKLEEDNEGDQEQKEEEPSAPAYDPWTPLKSVFQHIPIVLSENMDVAGLSSECGCEALKDHRPVRHSSVAQTLINSGADILGKGSIHGLMLGLTCNHTSSGPVKNPFSRYGISGGSQGGIAAAVAARVTPLGIGVDSIGDVRIPASLCGVIGFRPTTGKVDTRGMMHPSHTLDSVSMVARSVKDVRLLYNLLSSPASRLVSRPVMILPPLPVKKKTEEEEEEEQEEEEEEEGGAHPKNRAQAFVPEGDMSSKLRSSLDVADRAREVRRRKQAIPARTFANGEDIESAFQNGIYRALFSLQKPRELHEREKEDHENRIQKMFAILDKAKQCRPVSSLLEHLALNGVTEQTTSTEQAVLDGKKIGFPIKHNDIDSTVSQVISDFKKKLKSSGATLVHEYYPQVNISRRVWTSYKGINDADQDETETVSVDLCDACAAVADVIRRWELPHQITGYLQNNELTKERARPFTTAEIYDSKGGVKPDFYWRKKVEYQKPINVLDVVASGYCTKLEQEYIAAQLSADTAVDAETYHLAIAESRKAIKECISQYMKENGLDIVAYPSSVVPSLTTIGDDVCINVNGKLQECSSALSKTTTVASVAGLPAITLPCGLTRLRAGVNPGTPGSERVPVGLEMLTSAGQDFELLEIAEKIESMRGELADPILRSKWESTVYEQ